MKFQSTLLPLITLAVIMAVKGAPLIEDRENGDAHLARNPELDLLDVQARDIVSDVNLFRRAPEEKKSGEPEKKTGEKVPGHAEHEPVKPSGTGPVKTQAEESKEKHGQSSAQEKPKPEAVKAEEKGTSTSTEGSPKKAAESGPNKGPNWKDVANKGLDTTNEGIKTFGQIYAASPEAVSSAAKAATGGLKKLLGFKAPEKEGEEGVEDITKADNVAGVENTADKETTQEGVKDTVCALGTMSRVSMFMLTDVL